MPIEILMPALSPTMTEGNLAKWHKKEGDEVHSGDVLAEIETDKATMEVEAVDDGRVGRILVPEGAQGVKVNQPIALLLGEGEDAATLAGFAGPAAKPDPPAEPAPTPPQHEESHTTLAVRAGGRGRGAARQRTDLRQPAGAAHGAAGRARPRCDQRLGAAGPHRQGRYRSGRRRRPRSRTRSSGTRRRAAGPARGRRHLHRPCRRSGCWRWRAIRHIPSGRSARCAGSLPGGWSKPSKPFRISI